VVEWPSLIQEKNLQVGVALSRHNS